MKKEAPLKSRFHVTVSQEVIQDIVRSGQTPQAWLRTAAQQRLMREHREEPPLERVERLLEIAQKHINDLTTELKNVKGEFGKGHGVLIGAVKQLIESSQDATQQAAAVRRNQHDLSNLMAQIHQDIGVSIEKLGPTLLLVLSQQLRDLIQVEMAKTKESKPNARFPIPDRSQYPDRNL